MTISEYQGERVDNVRSWYEQIYLPLDGHVPESIRYMTLWAVFNALYNIADYPKVKLRSVSSDEGIIKPYIRGRDDDKKLRYISRQLAKDNELIADVFRNHEAFVKELAQRKPEIQQPLETELIQFEFNTQTFTLNLSELQGIASIDNRVFLENGAVLFQYHHLDLDLNKDGLPKDRPKFFRQVAFMLYQLRNNIVHGGSAAFFSHKTKLTVGAISLLNAIVQYLLNHSELLEQDGE
jgi:hypothetical protein